MQDTLRNALESNYTLIPNQVIIDPIFNNRNEGAYRAWSLMASKPQGFKFYTEVLARELGITRQAMAKRMDYLAEHDYLIKQPYRTEGGQRANIWTVVIPEIAMLTRTNMAQPNMVQTNMAQVNTNKKYPKQEVLNNKIDSLTMGERRPEQRVDNFSNRETDEANKLQMLPEDEIRRQIASSISDNNLDHLYGVVQLQKLMYYITDDDLSVDLVVKAIERTKERGGRNFTYTERMLKDWRSQHILTVQALDDYEKQIQDVKNKYSRNDRDKEIW